MGVGGNEGGEGETGRERERERASEWAAFGLLSPESHLCFCPLPGGDWFNQDCSCGLSKLWKATERTSQEI